MTWSVFDELWGLDPWVWGARRSAERARPYPAVNVYGNKENVVLTSEIPGLKAEDLEINVHGRSLTIKGKRGLPKIGEEECYTCNERVGGEFLRSLTLPYEADPEKVEARYENGVLAIHVPRTERDKPRKIEVKVN